MPESGSSGFVAIPIGDHAARQADAKCEGCGATGTVGRATRHAGSGGEVAEEHRYCARCWPEWSAFFRARWQEEARRVSVAWRDRPRGVRGAPPPPSGMSFVSATWHPIIELVQKLRNQARILRDPPPSDEDRSRIAENLARFAAEIEAGAGEREGPMPIEVRAFLSQYGRPPSPGAPAG